MDLPVQIRDISADKAKHLRKRDLIPAELYGHGTDNLHLAVEKKQFARIYKEAGESTILNVAVEGETRPVIIKEVQHDPVTGEYLHVDLYQVRMDETIEAEVPLKFTGESLAVKNEGGVLVESLRALPIEALPGNLPHEIEVDISQLAELDTTLYVRDLKLPEGVEPTIDEDTAVVSVATQEEEEEPAEEVSVEDVKVEGEEERKARADEDEEGDKEEEE